MKFSYAWLRSFVDPGISPSELADRLTMAGLEVESIEPAAAFSGVVVGEIASVTPHPESTRLRICTVDVGARQLQIVCGAPNVSVGMKVPAACEGARLPSGEIAAMAVRGAMSHGMLCSAKELAVGDDDSGLLVLADSAPVGMDLVDYMNLADEILTLKVTPNRADCLSVLGIARETAAISDLPFKSLNPENAPVTFDGVMDVTVAAPDACPVYCGRLIGAIDPTAITPDWLRIRLERSGLRSINAVVDVTNYVMLEMGQPLHAFDAAKITGGIQVRNAQTGEVLKLLSGVEATLPDDILVIADQRGPLALAGIMGGADSAVGDGTQCIFLESAFFSPGAVAGRARKLNLATDSSFRFERGVDFGNVEAALERATALILAICGGNAGKVTRRAGPLPARNTITLRLSRLNRLLGQTIAAEQAHAYLDRLGLNTHWADDTLVAVPPSFRFDLETDVDLIEEVARLHGYDSIATAPPRARQIMRGEPEALRTVDALRNILVDRDYQEVITYSFVDSRVNARFAADGETVAVMNPIAAHLDVMRSSLWVGLLSVLETNLNQLADRVRIFEIGRVFRRQADQYQQPHRFAGLCYGPAYDEQWGQSPRAVDFFDVKSDIEALLAPRGVQTVADSHPALHPGISARVLSEGRNVGWLGALHPRLSMEFGVPEGVIVFDLDLSLLREHRVATFAEVPRFPAMRRDLAVVVDESVPAEALLQGMVAAQAAFVDEVKIFDIYRGKGIDSGKKSIAFRVVLKDTQKTLTDTDADEAVLTLLKTLADRFDAKLRS